MPLNAFEIRKCDSCGLRYPQSLHTEEHSPSPRCPTCMGITRLILSQNLVSESKHYFPLSSTPNHKFAILLDNIRSAWNVGSILRTADGFTYSHAYMCGITPTSDNDAVKKTALGAENSVPWTYHKDAVTLAHELKSQDWRIIALEDHENSIQLADAQWQNKTDKNTLLIVGNETTGVDPHLLDLCDAIYHIPMYGEKKSFNVAIAFGIAAYALTK